MLEIINMGVIMKKGILSLVISSLLLITVLLWFFQVREHMNIYLLLFAVGVILVIGFSVYNGIMIVRESKRHLPVEDELSRKNKLRAGYYSYLFSIYLWILLYFLSDRFENPRILFAVGIMGMAVLFLGSLLYFKNRSDL
jgi:hypothetical protein